VGKQVCDGVLSGKNRTALDKMPAQNGLGFSGGGGGADTLVNLAVKDRCGGLQPKATWHTLGRYSGSGQWNGPSFKVIGNNPMLKVTFQDSGNDNASPASKTV
jgi:hypothetical protein